VNSRLPPGEELAHRRTVAVYRTVLRCYPRAFRQRWGKEVVQLFTELAHGRPRGVRSSIALWTAQLPDLARGFFGEWSRELGRVLGRVNPAVRHGVFAGALLSAATLAGNLGTLWQTVPGRIGSWLISAAALALLTRTGWTTVAGPGKIRRSLRNGLVAGLIAFTSANLTATVVVVTALDRLNHDPLQMTAFMASHETDFRSYQLHELLGGWIYGSICGTVLGSAVSGIAAAVSRTSRLEQRRR
jgi:hypothetical protein